MKITGLEVNLLPSIPYPLSRHPGYPPEEYRQFGLARIFTDEGLEGHAFYSAGILRELAGRWARAKNDLEGQDPFDREKIEYLMSRKYRWGEEVLTPLDVCLWDIAGKELNKPVYKLLGGSRDKILAQAATLRYATDEEYIEMALDCKKKGFKAFKIHGHDIPEDDIRLCRAIRETVGEEMILMNDPYAYPGPYGRKGALKVGREMERLNFYWYEDPLMKDDLEGYVKLCKKLEVPILISGLLLSSYSEYIRMGAIDIIRGDTARSITYTMKLAHLAEANHMNIEVHGLFNMLEAKSIHLAMAINNTAFFEQGVPEGVFDEQLYPGVFKNPIRIDGNGYIHAPTKPGIGYDMDFKEVERITEQKI